MTTAGRDMISGAAGLAIALAYYALADALPVSLLSDEIGAAGVPKSLAVEAFSLAAAKLPIKTRFVARLGEEG